jgi:esterase
VPALVAGPRRCALVLSVSNTPRLQTVACVATAAPVHPREQFVSINGLRLHYLEWGDVGAPTVVLLHGGSAHAHWWDLFAGSIADTYRVLALDLRGHGDSEHPDPPAYRISDYTRDLAAFVDRIIDQDQIDLIGHSLGGIIATAYAGVVPQRLNSLAIVDSQARISPAGARYLSRLRGFPQPMYRDRHQAIERFRLLPSQTNAAPGVLASIAAHAIRQLADGRWTLKFDRASLSHAEAQDLTATFGRLVCPLLFVRGAHSTLLSRDALTRLLAAAPHGESVEIPDAHHHVMLDNPGEFERTVRAFLFRHRALPSARSAARR